VSHPDPLQVRWIHGSESAKHNTDPDLQVHWHDDATVVLRQNKAINYEAPFLFLLFGDERALLLDTGATADAALFPLRSTVDALVGQWLHRHPHAAFELLVLHTHSHGDHVAGDGQLTDRPRTTVVSADRGSVYRHLGLTADLDRAARLDLGGRAVDCIASPGHDAAAVTYFDKRTGFLLTGDTVYPGRLYVEDPTAYALTIDRLVAFADTHPVSHVLGCHIEMSTTPGEDYPVRTTFQPDEPPLEMTVEQLRVVQRAVAEVGERPGRHVFDDFVLQLDG
jgi:glyoxylase-like metal-dependent hydrolase (beta-lactamase superfamily II)